MGLPRANRLKHRRDFDRIYKKGLYRQTPHLVLRALLEAKKNPIDGNERVESPPQIGISIGRKVSKKAVIRNRIKRQIKAVMRELLPNIPPGWKIIIGVRSQALKCEYKDFLGELKQLLVKAEIINGN
ncbi:MAG: ribonuclease P protein component [Prochloraceae cyanobacterium]|nr:ribonuclease P protein component [Prochloraceae cyanobacterium]